MPTARKLPGLLLLATVLLAGPHRLAADERWWGVQLIAYDEVARPEECVEVRAKLEHRDLLCLRPNMRGYPLCFHAPPFLDCCWARTASKGVATVPLRLPVGGPCPCRVQVLFPGSTHHRPGESVGRVFTWPADSPILVTDVDHTISDLPQLLVPFTANEDTPPLPGAVEALQEMSRDYRIVYLTARNHCLYNKTRDWLRLHGFPEGPLFSRGCAATQSVVTFKREVIADLRKRFPNVAVGVGDRAGDAEAYLANGLKTILINPKKPHKLPPQVVVVGSWAEAARRVCRPHPPVGPEGLRGPAVPVPVPVGPSLPPPAPAAGAPSPPEAGRGRAGNGST
jgi:hypothetical protein